MKYETPELTVLSTANNAIQGMTGKPEIGKFDGEVNYELLTAFEDWES
jgi:hypothetical protein